MAGFIILEDGRAYAASNSGTDATIRAIAAEVPDADFREWLLAQQGEDVALGMTCVDLREIAPRFRPVFYAAVAHAYARASRLGFESWQPGSLFYEGWIGRFRDLVEMIERWRAGEPPETFNPHMRQPLPPTGDQEGPGWA